MYKLKHTQHTKKRSEILEFNVLEKQDETVFDISICFKTKTTNFEKVEIQ